MSETLSPTILDRLLAAFRALVRAEFPNYTYLGLWEYAVQATDGKTVDCDLVDTSAPVPAHLAQVPMRPSILGATVTPVTTGGRCLVMFVNRDPTKPVCVSIEGYPKSAQIGDASTTLALSGGGPGVARLGDTVVAGIFAGTITSASTKASSG